MAFHHFVESDIQQSPTYRIEFVTYLQWNPKIHRCTRNGVMKWKRNSNTSFVSYSFPNLELITLMRHNLCANQNTLWNFLLTIRCLAISSYDKYSSTCSSIQSGKSNRCMIAKFCSMIWFHRQMNDKLVLEYCKFVEIFYVQINVSVTP